MVSEGSPAPETELKGAGGSRFNQKVAAEEFRQHTVKEQKEEGAQWLQ